MSAGPKTDKFTCLAAGVEFRGTVFDVCDGCTEFDVTPDPNYRHMVLPPPSRATLLLEGSNTLFHGGCSNTVEPDIGTPLVRDGGTVRPLRKQDHIKVAGAWVVDNQHFTSEWHAGDYLIRYIWTELHPYIRSTFTLIGDPKPGEATEETLTVCAPIYTEVFASDNWAWNVITGVAGCILTDSIQKEVEVKWFIPVPEPPTGAIKGVTHFLTVNERIQDHPILPGNLVKHEVVQDTYGLHVRVIVRGDDPLRPEVFKATYRLSWDSPRILLTITPDPPQVGQQTVGIHARNAHDSSPIAAGQVSVDGTAAGVTDAGGNASFPFTFEAGKLYRFEVDKAPFAPGVAVLAATNGPNVCDQLLGQLQDVQSETADLQQELSTAAPNDKANIVRALRALSQRALALRQQGRKLRCPGIP